MVVRGLSSYEILPFPTLQVENFLYHLTSNSLILKDPVSDLQIELYPSEVHVNGNGYVTEKASAHVLYGSQWSNVDSVNKTYVFGVFYSTKESEGTSNNAGGGGVSVEGSGGGTTTQHDSFIHDGYIEDVGYAIYAYAVNGSNLIMTNVATDETKYYVKK